MRMANEPLSGGSIRRQQMPRGYGDSKIDKAMQDAALRVLGSEVKGDGGEVDLDERAEVHGPRELAGAVYGAAERAKNEMMILFVKAHGSADTDFAGLLQMLLSKVARFCVNPLNGDSYEDAIGYTKLIREHAVREHTACEPEPSHHDEGS